MIMGFWGTKLYSNDITLDIRNSYIDYLYSGLDGTELVNKVLDEYKELVGTDEEALLYFAVADTSYEYGRLNDEIKSKVLHLMELEQENSLSGKKEAVEWNKTIIALKEKIISKQPPVKKINIPLITNPWRIGDLHAYKLKSKYAKEHGYFNKYMILLKVGEEQWGNDNNKKMNVFVIYDCFYESIPTIEDLKKERPLLHYEFDEEYYAYKKRYEKLPYYKGFENISSMNKGSDISENSNNKIVDYVDTYAGLYKDYTENKAPFVQWIIEKDTDFKYEDFFYLGNIILSSDLSFEERSSGRAFKGKLSSYEKWVIKYHESWMNKDF